MRLPHGRSFAKIVLSLTINPQMALQVAVSNEILRGRIRPRISWMALPFLLLVLWIVIGSGLLPASASLQTALQNSAGVGDLLFRLLIYLSTAIADLYILLRMLFGSDVVILTQTTLEIQRRIFGLSLTEKSFPNSTVNNLRYVQWSVSRFGMQRVICFESTGKTVTFARQATEGDCRELIRELIDAMLEIYRFPAR